MSLYPITPFNNIHVVRGDLTKGGLKMPALLRHLPKLNHSHFAYVGSVYGSGAWAVAEACAQLHYQCTLFIAKSDYTPLWLPELEKAGAVLRWCDPLPVATLHKQVTGDHPDLYNLTLGFDTPEFISDMSDILRESIPTPHPPEIWLPALSGVVARAACMAFPDTKIHAVSAAKHPGNIGRAILHTAPGKYHKPVLTPPPYPACPFSDAKVWQFAQKMAISGAYILNVSS